jgi:threonine aldolase
MGNFIKAVGSAFVGCFLAIWAFGKCKNSICKKDDNFERVAKKVAEKVENMQVQTEQPKEETTIVEVENEQPKQETEEPKNQAVKRERVVSGATEMAQGIY